MAQPTTPEAAHDAARPPADLSRVEGERDAAYVARDAAEDARTRAEVARNVAEAGGEAARAEATLFGEQVAFLEEQVRSARAYHADVVDTELAELRAERVTLLEEMAVLNEELLDSAEKAEHRDALQSDVWRGP